MPLIYGNTVNSFAAMNNKNNISQNKDRKQYTMQQQHQAVIHSTWGTYFN